MYSLIFSCPVFFSLLTLNFVGRSEVTQSNQRQQQLIAQVEQLAQEKFELETGMLSVMSKISTPLNWPA